MVLSNEVIPQVSAQLLLIDPVDFSLPAHLDKDERFADLPQIVKFIYRGEFWRLLKYRSTVLSALRERVTPVKFCLN